MATEGLHEFGVELGHWFRVKLEKWYHVFHLTGKIAKQT